MRQRVTGRYCYKGEDGETVYWKERLEPGRKSAKEFRFFHGNRESGRGCDPIVYNLPAVIKAKAVIFTEGEKQADIVNGWGLCGTTFDSGSNSRFPPAMVEHFRGKRVAVLRDNDEPGNVYAEMIGKTLHEVAESVRVVLLPGLPSKGDICDWILTRGNDKRLMLQIIQGAAPFVYVPEPEKPKEERRRFDRAERDITEEMIAAATSFPVERLLDFQNGYAKCLWHEEENPSLHHYAKRNRVKCFSCGFGGNSIDVVMKMDGVGFKDAVRSLCSHQ